MQRHRADQQGRRQRLRGAYGGEHRGHRAPADGAAAEQRRQLAEQARGGMRTVEAGPGVEQQHSQDQGAECRRRGAGAEDGQCGADGGQAVAGQQRGDGPRSYAAAGPGRGQGLPGRAARRVDRGGGRSGGRRRPDPGGVGRIRAVRRHRLIGSLVLVPGTPGRAPPSTGRGAPEAVGRTRYCGSCGSTHCSPE
ncbi:hypothetical protein ACFWIY_05165 [Streptomyces sioyaensis]|uniref:hypothetical protein n=1 Tax=Streptomyces sioyaensis TaxID=67364 RepID=UPI00365B4F7F